MALKMNAAEVMAYLDEVFPQVKGSFHIESLTEEGSITRYMINDSHLRPGGTVSGPTMFSLADVSVYAMVIGAVGRRALAVTTNCSIDFMRKPVANADLIGEGKLLKLGKLLAVGDVHIRSAGSDQLVARATLTYAIPPTGE